MLPIGWPDRKYGRASAAPSEITYRDTYGNGW